MIVVGGSGASNTIYNDVQVLSKVLGTTELGSTNPTYAWVNSYSPAGPNITVSSSPTATASTPAKNAATAMSGITSVLLAVVIGLVMVVAF